MKMTEEKPKLNSKLVDSNIFDLFKPLNSDDPNVTIDGSVELLKYFAKTDDSTEQRRYGLKRIIRGLGASTCSSKTVFFRTLVGILMQPSCAALSVDELVQVMEKELKLGKEIKNKEDSDALIGHILLCGSLIRSNKLDSGTDDDLSKCVQLLTAASHHKLVHSSMAFTFLIELLSKSPPERFKSIVWPIVAKQLQRPWERQNINTVHFLLAIHAKYPELLDADYLLSSLQTPEILSPLSYKHLGRMFWGNTTMNAVTHPAYDELSQFLCQSNSSQLVKFWRSEVNECLAAPSKLKEIVTVKILKDLFNSRQFKTKTLLKLLTDRFIKMIVASLKNVKQMKKGSYLVYYYDEFFEAIDKHLAQATDDDEKIELITRFILHPGALTIEKYTSKNIVHQMIQNLGSAGVVRMTEIYQTIFIGKLAKDPTDSTVQWLNVERQHAVQMMQFLVGLKVVQSEIAWRIEQTKFLAGVSLFYMSTEGKPTTDKKDSSLITKDLWMNVKNIFYLGLQTKLPNLEDQHEMLLSVVQFCNEILSKKGRDKYLREPITSEAIESWKKMFEFVATPLNGSNKLDKKLDLIFRIMFMFMGLQLFREQEMAQLAIVDLEKCMENINQKKITAKRSKKIAEDEPQWIEVVVDIFLHLLSKNTKFLKFVVNTLFSHLCPSLTLTAVNQILSVLDMSIANPLSNEEDEDSEDDEEEENDGKADDSAAEDESEDDEESAEGEEDDDDDDMDDDEGTAADHLRNALSSVLGIPSDTESVDLDDMTEEEAARLDKGLSAVFQSMKKSNPKKKSKKERIVATTVMHFRIRVLDLVESYLKTAPSMEVCLEIMLALFGMVELSVDGELKPLYDRIDKVLAKLLSLRQFHSVANVEEDHLCKILDGLMERKVNPAVVEIFNKLLSKSVAFIVSNLHLVAKQNGTVLAAITTYATTFLDTRGPKMSFVLLKDLFQLRWIGIWSIGVSMAEHGFDSTNQNIRPLRRMQLFELLGQLYKNHGFIKQNSDSIGKWSRKIVGRVVKYVDAMQQMDKVQPKEFLALTTLLCEVHKGSRNVDILKLNDKIDWKGIGDKVQNIRQKIVLLSLDSYQMFCRQNGMKVLKKSDVQIVADRNGHSNGVTTTDDHPVGNKKQKRKLAKSSADNDEEETAKMNKKQKKLSKEERLRIASEGFNGISFASVSVDDVEVE
ncbi:myb-binding protein 1A [Bradysia coprophila]|uniref:myb-binding protein 1A n=1 Tax=Bradysia coprophila TaxID=38358 RepID=UPI00187DAC31|nr:myb-binding protein 1A [Bradysia coprophila]